MRRGPKGAAIDTQLEVTATRTWKFGPEVIRKRLGLPEDAKLFVAGDMGIVTNDNPLTAVATEVRRPKVAP